MESESPGARKLFSATQANLPGFIVSSFVSSSRLDGFISGGTQ